MAVDIPPQPATNRLTNALRTAGTTSAVPRLAVVVREREISEPWPVAGLSGTLHVFNGPDFRSRAFKRGCEDAGIAIAWRPPGEPRFGGHIERLIGTQMGKLHLLPGTTFSNEQDLCDYDSKRHVALTLRELEPYVALDIVGSYHQSIHSSLGRPPIAV